MKPVKIRSRKSSINISQYLKKTTCTISSQSRHYHKPLKKLHKYPTTGSRWALNPPSGERLTHAARSSGSKINAAIYFDLVRSFIFTLVISTTKISIFCIVFCVCLFVYLYISISWYISSWLFVYFCICLWVYLPIVCCYVFSSVFWHIFQYCPAVTFKHILILQYCDA